MDSHKKKSSAKKGMLPGSAIYVGENPPIKTKIYIHIYDNHSYTRIEGLSLTIIQDALAANQSVWIDVSGLADSPKISELCTEFAIHPLFVEDILNTHQRAKLDEIDGGFFVVFKLLHSATHHLSYNVEQLSMVVKKSIINFS
nr:CorA family divalent cation transporter [Legionella tunisiensis]